MNGYRLGDKELSKRNNDTYGLNCAAGKVRLEPFNCLLLIKSRVFRPNRERDVVSRFSLVATSPKG